MLSEERAKDLVRRLRALPFDGEPDDGAGRRREVGQALISATDSEPHAEAVVAHLLKAKKFFPVPVEIWEAAESVAPPAKLIAPRADCVHCGGTGFERKGQGVAVCRCRKVFA